MSEVILDILKRAKIFTTNFADKKVFKTKKIKENRIKLEATLNKEQSKMLNDLIKSLENYVYEKRDDQCVKSFCLGVDMGKDMADRWGTMRLR